MWEEDEDVGALAAGKGVDRSATGVAGGSADDSRPLAALFQGIVHQPGKKLHGHILERERRAVEELHRRSCSGRSARAGAIAGWRKVP